MGHCGAVVICMEDESPIEIIDDNHGFDYFQSFEEDENNKSWYRGFILKDGKKNEYMYIARDGKEYSYRANIEEVDWDKTLKVLDFCCFVDYRMNIQDIDFMDKGKFNKKEFIKFFKKRLQNGSVVELIDVHL
jgi:hypothetical protein